MTNKPVPSIRLADQSLNVLAFRDGDTIHCFFPEDLLSIPKKCDSPELQELYQRVIKALRKQKMKHRCAARAKKVKRLRTGRRRK